MSSQVVVVLGMHRSYTSLLAAWLHANGVVMYEGGPDADIALSEDPEILNLHEDIIQAHGMNWLNIRSPLIDPQGSFRKRACDIWDRRSGSHEFWGWKDPRTSILFPSLWSQFQAQACYLCVYRNPIEVVESLFLREIKRRAKQHFLSRAVPGLMRWYLRKNKHHFYNLYLNCWNYYNQSCIHIINSVPASNRLVLDANELIAREDDIRTFVNDHWQIPLANERMSTMVLPSTIDKSTDTQGIRKELLEESRALIATWRSLRSF